MATTAALRPALLAPSSEAASALDALPLARDSALSRLKDAVLETGNGRLTLSPAILRGVSEHAAWTATTEDFRRDCADWLAQARQASIIYAPSTDVWRKWLRGDGPLGALMDAVVGGDANKAESLKRAVAEWRIQSHFADVVQRTDKTIRGRLADLRPIEARARTSLRKHADELLGRIDQWLELLGAEPRLERGFVQQQIEKCRLAVMRQLPKARVEIGTLQDGNSSPSVAAACKAAASSLDALGAVFEATAPATALLSVTAVLGAELLCVDGVTVDSNLEPLGDPTDLLQHLARVHRHKRIT